MRERREKVSFRLSFLGYPQCNAPFFSQDEWVAVQVMSEILLWIHKSVSETPSGGSFNLKKSDGCRKTINQQPKQGEVVHSHWH